MQKKKRGKKGSNKSRSTATAPASLPSSQIQQPQPVATESMDIDTPSSTAPSKNSSEGIDFTPLNQSIHAPSPKTAKKAPRKASSRSEPSTGSEGSRKSRRIMIQIEKANQEVNIAELEQHLINDNPDMDFTTSEPDNQSEFQPSTTGSALTDITNQPIFNARRSDSSRKRRHTEITDDTGILTRKDLTKKAFGPVASDFGFEQSPIPKTRYSKKHTSKTLRF